MMTSPVLNTLMPTENSQDKTDTREVSAKVPAVYDNTHPPSEPTGHHGDLQCDDAEAIRNQIQRLGQGDPQQQKEPCLLQELHSGKQQDHVRDTNNFENLFEEQEQNQTLHSIEHQQENKGEGHPQNTEPGQGQRQTESHDTICHHLQQQNEEKERSAYDDEESLHGNKSVNEIRNAEENVTVERESETASRSGLGLPRSSYPESGITDSSRHLSSGARSDSPVTHQPPPDWNSSFQPLDNKNQFEEEEEGNWGKLQGCCDCLQACLCFTCCCGIRILNKCLC